MKTKYLLTTLILLLSVAAQAQTEKGNWLLGATSGGFVIKNNRDYQQSQYSFGLSPKAGYFLADNLVVGLRLDVGLGFYESAGEKGHSFGFGVTPFGRYYFPINERIKIPAELSVGFASSAVNWGTIDNTYRSLEGSARSGVAIFLNPHVSLDLLAGYSYTINDDVFGNAGGRIAGDFGFSFYLDCQNAD